MNFYFLSANEPLTKTHIRTNQTTETKSYPMVKYFTSNEESATTISQFFPILLEHSQQGHCLLKGKLTEPLNNQPRASTTDRLTPTEWLVFDIDGGPYQNAEEFINDLPKPFKNCSYIEQLSSSAGIHPGYKAHLFFFLERPITPSVLKTFIIHLNLTISNLENNISLNPGGLSLGYPLDIGTNANATPLYIAAPICVGFDDPIPQRIQLVEKDRQTINFNFTSIEPATVEAGIKQKIASLRNDKGLPKKTPKLKNNNGLEILNNVDPVALNGQPFEERGFVYLPINPNNKYTYYHPVDNPTLVFNFRGEPPMPTAKLLPDYWEQFQSRNTTPPINEAERHILIFRDIKSDLYFNGWASKTHLEIYPTKNRDRLRDFAMQNNAPMPAPIPDWVLDFDPTNDVAIDINKRYLNLYRKTPYLETAISNPVKIDYVPPTIHSIIWSVVGDNQECYDHFINWLAFLIQTRQKTKTAWIFQGIEGTGKGVLFHLILRPILGHRYCQEKLLGDLADSFNDWMRDCLLIFFDETKHFKDNRLHKDIPNKLKNIITEPVHSIRAMRTNAMQIDSYCNCLFATNELDAIYISESDRRYNVCPEQTKPFVPPDNLETLIKDELQDFTHFLYQFPVIRQAVQYPLQNYAKQKLRLSSSNPRELFFSELKKGNFEYFSEIYEDHADTAVGQFKVMINTIELWAVRWMERKPNEPYYLRRDELLLIYSLALSVKEITPRAFSNMLIKHGIQTERKWFTKEVVDPHTAPEGPTRLIPMTWNFGLNDISSLYTFYKSKRGSHETRLSGT